jgi:putative spermidine/putrescine transport system permease protein
MVESRLTRALLRVATAGTLAFIYAPLVVIGLYAFNANVTQGWPIDDFSTKWFRVAWEDPAVRDALKLSLEAALGATVIALVLGTLAALAVARFRFFGRETISFLVISRSRCPESSPGSHYRRPTRTPGSRSAC